MICSRCKKEIPEESRFCLYCGKRLESMPTPQRRRRRREKGSGTIKKLSGNRSKPYAAVSGAGMLIGTYATSHEAVEALDTFNARQLPADKSKYTLEQVWESFQQSPAWDKLSQKGKDGLMFAWPRLAPLHGRKAISIGVFEYQEILDAAMLVPRYKKHTEAELAKMKPYLRKRYADLVAQPPKPLGYDGKNRIKQLVSHLYNEMIRLQITRENLSDVLVLPAQSTRSKRNFTDAEKAILRQHDDDPAVKIILIYIETGLRLNELLKMPRDAVDLDARIMTGGSKTESGRNRIVPILESTFPYVKYFYDQGGKYLIEKNGKPIGDNTFRQTMFYATMKSLGIQYQDSNGKNTLTPHRARHTFVADSIQGGMSPEALTKIAGYSKYDVAVDKYADDLSAEYLRAEMEKKK